MDFYPRSHCGDGLGQKRLAFRKTHRYSSPYCQILFKIRSLLPQAAHVTSNAFSTQSEVTPLGPHPHMQATILVGLRCQNAEVHRSLKRYEARIQSILHRPESNGQATILFTNLRF
jgi:hypothetical protein